MTRFPRAYRSDDRHHTAWRFDDLRPVPDMAPIKIDANTEVHYAHWCLCGKEDRCLVLARSSAEMASIRAEGDFNDHTLYQAFSVGEYFSFL